jgi:lipopolysaccharide export system permease protein
LSDGCWVIVKTYLKENLIIFAGLTEALAQAALGKQTGELALKIFSLEIIRTTDTLLPLALFLGVLLTMSRWYRDSEVTALEACGVSLFSLWLSLLVLASVFAVVVSYLTFYLSPLAAGQVDVVKTEARSTGSAMVGVRAGIFYRGFNNSVYYVESLEKAKETDEKQFSGVFARAGLVPGELDTAGGKSGTATTGRRSIDTKTEAKLHAARGKSGIVTATTGRRSIDAKTGAKLLILDNGHYYETIPGQKKMRIFAFEQYSASLTKAPARVSGGVDAIPTIELFKSDKPEHIAELHWRMARPIALYLLVSLAMVLAYTNPRQSRFGNMFLALLVFFLYSNLLGVFVGMLSSGKVPGYIGLWPIHGMFAVFAVYAYSRRQNHLPLFVLPRHSISRLLKTH